MRHLRRPVALPVACLLVGVLLAGLLGCDFSEYEITLTPQGSSMDRSLTATYHSDEDDSPFPAEQAAALAELYDEQLEAENPQTVAFRGRFAGQMPSDIGGAGEYVVYETRFGDAFVYSEQFRGTDEPTQFFDVYFAWVDEVIDLLNDALEDELGHMPAWKQLEAVMDTDVRKDLKDLGVYYYLALNQPQMLWDPDADDEAMLEQMGMRVLQYLVTHGYFTAEQLPMLTREFAGDEGDAAIVAFTIEAVRHKAGIDDEAFLEALRDLLLSPDKLGMDIAGDGSESDVDDDDLSTFPEPPLEFGLGPEDKLAVTLLLPDGANLVNSNGLVIEETATVTWEDDLPQADVADYLPVFCYAMWTVSNSDSQIQHLGKVALTGDDLFAYALWRNALTPLEAAEWEAVVTALSPDDETAIDTLRNFRFSDEPLTDTEDNPVRSNAEQGVNLLLSALVDEPEEPSDMEE